MISNIFSLLFLVLICVVPGEGCVNMFPTPAPQSTPPALPSCPGCQGEIIQFILWETDVCSWHSCSYKRRIQWTKSPVSWDVHPCHQHQLHPAPASPGEIWSLPGRRVRDGTRNQAVCILHVHYASSIAHNAMKWNNYHVNLNGDIWSI